MPGAQPKKKISQGRRNSRRAHHALKAAEFSRCPQCRSLVPSHQVCPVCGHYRTSEIVHLEQPRAKYR